MNCCRETTKMGVPPGNSSRGTAGLVPRRTEWYVAGADTRGRQEGRPNPWSQQVIHEMSGLSELLLGLPIKSFLAELLQGCNLRKAHRAKSMAPGVQMEVNK
jgi:hypothetical protein